MLISVGHKETERIKSRFKGPSFTTSFWHHLVSINTIIYSHLWCKDCILRLSVFWISGLSNIGNIKKTSDLMTHDRYDQKLIKSTMNLKTKSKLDFCAVRSFWLIKILPMERCILYSIHLLSMVNNYNFSVLMKIRKCHFPSF